MPALFRDLTAVRAVQVGDRATPPRSATLGKGGQLRGASPHGDPRGCPADEDTAWPADVAPPCVQLCGASPHGDPRDCPAAKRLRGASPNGDPRGCPADEDTAWPADVAPPCVQLCGVSPHGDPRDCLADEVVDLTGDSPDASAAAAASTAGDAGRGRAVALCAMETTASKGDVRAWLAGHRDDPAAIFDSLACVRLHVLPLRKRRRYAYRLPGLHAWPHGFVDAETLDALKNGCVQHGVDVVDVSHTAVADSLVSTTELESLRTAIHSDVAATDSTGPVNAERRNRGRCARRHNFVSSRAATKNNSHRGPGSRPMVTGPGMGSDRVFGLDAAKRLVRHGNEMMYRAGFRARHGGHAAEISPGDPYAVMEGAAFLLSYDGDDDGVSPTWCRWHIDEDNASEPDFQDTVGVCFWNETPDGRQYRLVCALYTREAVSTWLRVYRPTGRAPTDGELEYRSRLVAAMETVARRPWPPPRVARLWDAPLYADSTRSSLDHKSGNAGALLVSGLRHWEKYGAVRRVAALLGGMIGVNDAVIGLARDFPEPNASMLGGVGDGDVAAGRLLTAACVACEGSGLLRPGWSLPSWARGQSTDGSHPSNQSRLCRWMPTQVMLNVLRRRLLSLETVSTRDEFAADQVRTLTCALSCISVDSGGVESTLGMLAADASDGSTFLKSRTGVKAVVSSLDALGELARLADPDEVEDAELLGLLQRLGRRDVDVPAERARIKHVGLHEWKSDHRCLCRLVCCCRLLSMICGVSGSNGVVLHGIVVCAVALQAVRVSRRMANAVVRGGWVRAGSGTSTHLREAGWVVSHRVESLGRSTHATILREILQPDCLQETDGETEFENYPCEGDRALSTRLSEHKMFACPGFPRVETVVHLGALRALDGQRQRLVDGAGVTLLRYRWTAAVDGYGPCDDCSDVFARWTAQGGRNVRIWPSVWHGLL